MQATPQLATYTDILSNRYVLCATHTGVTGSRFNAEKLVRMVHSMAFQSPAQNYTETHLSLGDLVHLSPYSTYLMRSDSSFPDVGILKRSVLSINRALTPAHGQLIVAELDGELTLRRLLLDPVPALQAPDAHEIITLLDVSLALPVWGVVAYALTEVPKLGFSGPAGE